MTILTRGARLCLGGALVLVACGGKDTGPNPPPPPPPAPAPTAIAKQAGDQQVAAVGQAVATPPSVKVTTTGGAAIAGVTVTFAVASGGGTVTGASPATGADGIATVGSWTLGPAAGDNSLTATVAGSGIAGNPVTFTATAQLAAFNPATATTLGGTQNFSSVNIPAGVTVTVTSDLVLNATGAVTIAGNLAGDCKAITVNAEGALTVSGTLNTGCAGGIPAGGAPALVLVGKGGYTLNAPGGFIAAGDVTITNDPTLTDANFAPGAPTPPAAVRGPGRFPAVGEPCIANGYTGVANPANATNGTDSSPNGTNGRDGSTWTLRCKGGSSIVLSGPLSLTGQHGGRGGNGTHASGTAAASTGGNGGKGGMVKIQAIDNITIGAGGTIRTGDGGIGGHATADGSSGHGGNVGASATATGGKGGSPGLFSATAKNGSITVSGGLTLQIGNGGTGGNATATGGDGHDAPACPPALGGPAEATAGDGGSTPDKTFQAAGAVTGLANVTVTGGTPGTGGNGTATSGKGGNGAQPCKPGANGGDPTARGGAGGNGDLRNQNGVKISAGGNGGNMEVRNGRGGQGWSDCILPTWEPGGNGGVGGTAHGFNGSGGTGFTTGSYGSATFNVVGNGGDGGNGLGPGAGGAAGSNSALLINTNATIINPSFQPGLPGAICVGTATKTFIVAAPTSDLSGHEPFLLQVGSRPGQVTIGSTTMSISGLLNNSTIVLAGTRTGNNFTLNGTGVINTNSGPRNATVTFTGTIGPNGITGTLSILIAGFPNPAVYPVSDP